MEGIYFFGEYQRWNLGWNNPNQAGAFIAMLIPWLWIVGRLREWPCWKVSGFTFLLLVIELGLWFLLCKTYSRGALVAAAFAGIVFFLLNRPVSGGRLVNGWRLFRVLGIGGLLLVTGFFGRIDPDYVSQDASAGNRLTLWKGGLQMIAASPWRGWGAGKSGSEFMHWFQPLDAKEAYAGMVNSYLHVGVEYGLPALVMVVTIVLTLLAFSLLGSRFKPQMSPSESIGNTIMMAAGASLLTFTVSNIFSTLWVFKNLWWLPMLCCSTIIGIILYQTKTNLLKIARTAFTASLGLSTFAGLTIFGTGSLISSKPKISLTDGGYVNISHPSASGKVLFFPDRSVLGGTWGKEIRRMTMLPEYQATKICVVGDSFSGKVPESEFPPEVIIACGSQAQAGLAALTRFPESHLILVHPLGRADVPEQTSSNIVVMLPQLDTRSTGRGWRVLCKQRGWSCTISPGVGQDVRLLWPSLLTSTTAKQTH